MSNPNAPFGLRPVRYKDGRPYSPLGAFAYTIADSYSHAIGVGDLVARDPAGSTYTGPAEFDPGLNIVKALNSGGAGAVNTVPALGVFAGATWNLTDGSIFYRPYWPASQTTFNAQGAYNVLVADSADLVFEVQFDVTGFTPAQVGTLAELYAVDSIDANGRSTSYATGPGGTNSATATLQLKILGLSKKPRNGQANVYGAYSVAEVLLVQQENAYEVVKSS
jgi:hypothetical protein